MGYTAGSGVGVAMPDIRLSETESRIKNLLVSQLNVGGEALASFDANTRLLGQGIGLDSVEAMSLASEIEFAFEVSFRDDELTAEVFRTIGSLASAVEAKRREEEATPSQ
jgi:acyl carrier protein